MFLFRSVFWLALAFMVIKPGMDLGATANEVSAQAMQGGQQLLASQIAATPCDTLQCAGGKALIAAALTPTPSTVGIPMHTTSTAQAVPLPRPRPKNRAG